MRGGIHTLIRIAELPGVIKYTRPHIPPTMRANIKAFNVTRNNETKLMVYNDLTQLLAAMNPGDTITRIEAMAIRNPALDTIAPENRPEPADALQLTHVLKSKELP